MTQSSIPILIYLIMVFANHTHGISQSWLQLGDDIDGEAAGDQSGYSVALSADGSILAIGAPSNGDKAGHVRVYQSSNDVWHQLGDDIDGEAADDRSGHSVALSADGSILAIGAYNNEGAGSNAVRVYRYNSTVWHQLGDDIDGEAPIRSVALSEDGSILAIGAPDGAGSNAAGHVRVYQYNSTVWHQLGDDIDGEAAYDRSGWSVALSEDGSIVAIGALFNDGDAGHVRVYQYNSTVWHQLGDDIDGEAADDRSGHSVALSDDGSIVAIGAYNNDGAGSNYNAGHVRVYQYNSTVWHQLGDDIDGEAAGDKSGYSVALSADGSILAIGAIWNDGAVSDAGHVRVYQYNSTVWHQLGDDIDGEAADDESGWSVALSADGTILAIGARNNDGAGRNAGNVRCFYWGTAAPTSSPTVPTFHPTIDPTTNPTSDPTLDPTIDPTSDPTSDPTFVPTIDPTSDPTSDPTIDPTIDPTNSPSTSPSASPSNTPTTPPTNAPSQTDSSSPSYSPTICFLLMFICYVLSVFVFY